MDKIAKLKNNTSRKLVAAASVAMCLLCGAEGIQAYAAPSPQVVATQAATMVISGTVKDSAGNPIVGANVMEKGTTRGIATDLDGKFTLKVSPHSTIVISYLGYASQQLKASASMDVTLAEDNANLDEIVVVGYGQQKKANLTGAVASVDIDKAMRDRPQMDMVKSLQGVVPGLSIVNTQGGIDAQPSMTIRGVGTLSNNETSSPYIVVDGVPVDNLATVNPQDIASISVLKDAASSSIYGSRAAFGVILITTKSGSKKDKITVNYTNNFAWSTPTILPDYADAPSQMRALIDVNKRNGTDAELFGMYMEDLLPLAELWQQQNGHKKSGYRELRPYVSDSDVGDYKIDPNTGKALFYADWDVKDIMYRNWTPSQNHYVNVNGTSGRTTYYLSFGYDKKEGVMTFNPDNLKRYTAQANITSQITDWLQVGTRISYTDRAYSDPYTVLNTYQYLWRWGSFFEPYGTINGTGVRSSALYRQQAGDRTTTTDRTRLTAFMKADIIKGLTLNADFTYDFSDVSVDRTQLPVVGYNAWGNMTAPTTLSSATHFYESSDRKHYWNMNVYGNYAVEFGKHNLNVMLGGSAEETKYRSFYSQRKDLVSPIQPEFNLATGEQLVGGSHWSSATAGYFGRINYDWNDIWLLELNGRFDGSSSFPANDRWAFFPSGSLGYRFSQENYFEPIRHIVSNGKLRASFGEIGNDAVGDYMYIETIEKLSSTNTKWLDASGSKITMYDLPKLVSKSLTWETIQTTDIGLDLGFLNNSLNVVFDWYQRKTLDMLAPSTTLPDVLGTSAPLANAGSLRTRGWELAVTYNKRFGDFNLFLSGNIADSKTVVTEWRNDSGILSQYFSGKNYGDIYGFETDRLFTEADFTWGTDANGNKVRTGYAEGVANQDGLVGSGNFQYGPGDIKYKDLDGNGTVDGGKGTETDHGDLKVIGNSTPRFQYGFRLGGDWKGIDLDMYFQGVGKWDQWQAAAFVVPFARGADGIYENQMDYWTPENTDAFYPRPYPGSMAGGNVPGIGAGAQNFYPQSRYLIDRSYLRFKTLTVGYTLPQSLTKKWFIEKLRLYVSAENLCELINNSIAPVDPEIDASEFTTANTYGSWGRIDPMMRTVSFGLQLTL